ncbi:MAG: Co2+/Mg2+ efflux protein ApaG [Pseudomonadota bacterium]
MGIAEAFIGFFAGLLASLVANELWPWIRWLSEKCIERAANHLPVENQNEMREEWLAELHAFPGDIRGLLWAFDLIRGAGTLSQQQKLNHGSADDKNIHEDISYESRREMIQAAVNRVIESWTYRAVSLFSEGEVEVSVEPFYLDALSQPNLNKFLFGYRIKIENRGSNPIRLMNRHWDITDSSGHTAEFDGEGVVGQQPLIAPGGSFEYGSAAPLATLNGSMVGHYQLISESGKRFYATIPAFSLNASKIVL